MNDGKKRIESILSIFKRRLVALRVALLVRQYVRRSVLKKFQKVLKQRFCESNKYET